MREKLIVILLALCLPACASTSTREGVSVTLGRDAMLVLPESPGYPGVLNATQRVIGQYGDRRAAFDAALSLSPDSALVVLTASGGPRILSLTWTASGIEETRTPLAPQDLNGLSVLADIFLSLWPVDAVQASLPAGASVTEEGTTRRIGVGERVIAEIETLERSAASMRQRFRNLDLGYTLTIVTEFDP